MSEWQRKLIDDVAKMSNKKQNRRRTRKRNKKDIEMRKNNKVKNKKHLFFIRSRVVKEQRETEN